MAGSDQPVSKIRTQEESGRRPGDPDSLTSYRNHRSRLQLVPMAPQELTHQRDPSGCGNIGKPHQARMGCRLPEDELAEIRVYRDQDSIVLGRPME